ncbi:acyltransferase family protein [Pseudonocardia phyllosphaerae]|uniref:acyltransferase family protein n=1 Tax=Pseudonocardia phyllosphaerae TaxID=3390502 RepID=UPI00397DC9C7
MTAPGRPAGTPTDTGRHRREAARSARAAYAEANGSPEQSVERSAGARRAAERGVVGQAFPQQRGGRRRTDWVDAAKGICIVLVVVHHAVMFLEPHGLIPGPLNMLNTALASLRMPLFFLVSGLFLPSVLAKPWRTLLHRRVALFAWLYFLWTGIQFGVTSLLPAGVAPSLATQDLSSLLLSPLLPAPSMWFLYALAVFSIGARLTRNVPTWVLLGATGILSALAGAEILQVDAFAWEFMARYAFFFALGWHARSIVEKLAAAATPLRVGLAAVLAGLGAGAEVLLNLKNVFGVAFALNVVAVGGGVLVAGLLARWKVGRVAIFLGRRTLPIYLTNILFIGLLTTPVAGLALPAPAQVAVLAVMVVATIAGALGLHKAIRAAHGTWLYDLPGRWAVRPAIG